MHFLNKLIVPQGPSKENSLTKLWLLACDPPVEWDISLYVFSQTKFLLWSISYT
jgi:hypothetical protein